MLFVDSALAHGSDKDGEVGLFDEVMDLLKDTMANGTSINKNDGVLCSSEVLENDVDDVVFTLGLIIGL